MGLAFGRVTLWAKERARLPAKFQSTIFKHGFRRLEDLSDLAAVTTDWFGRRKVLHIVHRLKE
jgi:hypothetical protein